MKVRRRAKKGPIIVTLLILITLVFGSLYLFNEYFKKEKVEDIPAKLSKKEEPIISKGSLTIAGNVLLNDKMWYDAKDETGGYDFKYAFKQLKETINVSDVNYYSQQSIIGGKDLGLSSFSTYNSPIEVGKAMIDAKFNMISLANYHAYDKGTTGITNSTNFWKDNNAAYSGTSLTAEDRLKNNILVKNDITYALLSYTMGTDTKYAESFFVNNYSNEQVKKDVNEMLKTADVIIVSIDWGNTKTNEVTTKQKEIATYLSELGVNIVIGNTGFSIESIEKINNTLVFYSLGNLLSAHVSIDTRISAVVDFDVELIKTTEEKKIEFKDINVLLTYAYNKDGTNYHIIPFTKITNELKDYKTYYEKYKTLLTKDKDYINVYSLGDTSGNS